MTTPTDVLVERVRRGLLQGQRAMNELVWTHADAEVLEALDLLAARVRELEGALREIAEMRIPGSGRLSAWAGFAQMLQQLALAALAEKGSEL